MSGERFIHSAYAYLYIGSFERAELAFSRAIEMEPDNPEPYFLASITAHRNQSYEEALQLAQKATELAPEETLYRAHLNTVQASLLVEQAKSAYIQGDTACALRMYQSAIESDPLHDEARSQLSELCQLYPEHCGQTEEEFCDR